MASSRFLKRLHFSGTAWLILNAAFLLVLSLKQAGLQWWVIFSLSGYSAVLILFFTSVYVFAIFRGVVQRQNIDLEHPLTSSIYYTYFYDLTPILGAMAGLFSIALESPMLEQLAEVAIGTLSMTFFVWIILDPLLGMIEMFLPQSKIHRKKRVEEAREKRKRIEEDNEKLLREIIVREELSKQKWQSELKDRARELVELAAEYAQDKAGSQSRIIEIGAEAWQKGGIDCMQYLYEAAEKSYQQSNCPKYGMVCIGKWWEGIGTWEGPTLEKLLKSI